MASEIIGNLTVCLRKYQSSTLLVFFQGSSFRKIFICPIYRILQFLYMLIQYKEKKLLKSTCLTSSFTCPGPPGSGKCWALLFERKHKIFVSLALFEGKHKKIKARHDWTFVRGIYRWTVYPPSQRFSNMESIFITRHHHVKKTIYSQTIFLCKRMLKWWGWLQLSDWWWFSSLLMSDDIFIIKTILWLKIGVNPCASES